MGKTIRVFITDDHQIVRRGIRQLLSTEKGIEVIGEASNGREAVAGVEQLKPDIVLMDLVMPVMDGIEAIRQIKAGNSSTQILVLTSFATDDKVFPAIKAGALGYLIKDTSPDELINAIRQVHKGEPTLHSSIAQKLLKEISHSSDSAPVSLDPLTEREVEVLKLIARGLSNQEIAETLVVSVATVYTHVSRVLDKLHLASRTQAALYALREGLASLYDEG
ncbi:MAG: response regulator transcription factor [Anaerolineales bacterium]|nr:response regulator transcription factor [Anaerolineales bacterium]MCB9144991.1 response regulator transcription factor [Anaerolineales bacterium]